VKILAIDPGTVTGGWAFVEDGVVVDSGHWGGHGVSSRLVDDVIKMAVFLKPDVVIVERYTAYRGRNKESQAVAEVVGAILYSVQSLRGRTNVFSVPYSAWNAWWKQFEISQIAGGNPVEIDVKNEHELDAIHMALGYFYTAHARKSKGE